MDDILVQFEKGIEEDVDFPTFQRIVQHKLARQAPHEQAMTAFHHLDIRGTGLLDEGALTMVVRELGLPFTPDEIRMMITEFDVDKDGKLALGEFLAIFSTI